MFPRILWTKIFKKKCVILSVNAYSWKTSGHTRSRLILYTKVPVCSRKISMKNWNGTLAYEIRCKSMEWSWKIIGECFDIHWKKNCLYKNLSRFHWSYLHLVEADAIWKQILYACNVHLNEKIHCLRLPTEQHNDFLSFTASSTEHSSGCFPVHTAWFHLMKFITPEMWSTAINTHAALQSGWTTRHKKVETAQFCLAFAQWPIWHFFYLNSKVHESWNMNYFSVKIFKKNSVEIEKFLDESIGLPMHT